MQILWYPDRRLLFAEWKIPGTVQEQKAATDMTIELMKEKRVRARPKTTSSSFLTI